MKRIMTAGLVILFLAGLGLAAGCGGLKSGATIRLSGVNLGTVNMDGKPLGGLPSARVDLVLDVSAQRVDIKYSADGSTITLIPSGATIELKPGGVTIKGVKTEQTRVEWVVPTATP